MIDLYKYIKKSDKLVLAVSGGLDSVVLLDLVSKKHPKDKLIIAHVNHGLRDCSNNEEKFVKELSEKYGIKYQSIKLNLRKSDENSARKARYKFLREVKNNFGAKYILTAHHLDDQLETILLNILRGSGPIKVWGMKKVSNDVFRPLLDVSREEVEEYATKEYLKHVKDLSNSDLKYRRNKVRHKIIPELKNINPSLLNNIKNINEVSAELSDFINSEVEKFSGNILSVEELKSAKPFIAKEVIKRKLHNMFNKESEVYKANIDEVYNLLEKNGTKTTEFGGMIVKKDYKNIIFGYIPQKKLKPKLIVVNKITKFGKYSLFARVGKTRPTENNILLSDKFKYNLKVRSWEKGDKIKTISGTKKLSDIFTNAKISLDERKKWPILVSNNEIIWVPKLASSSIAKKDFTKKHLIIEVK